MSGIRGDKYFDRAHRRLVYVNKEATAEFWDARWQQGRNPAHYGPEIPKRSLVVRYTKKYLPAGSKVLEGGCGLARNSWHLHLSGYQPIALDFAEETISFLKQHVPQVAPVMGDVRALPFADASIDGYWSLGVIEHFYDGYGAIRDEARRVIRPGGFLFLTFPYMSPLRRLGARLGRFDHWHDSDPGRRNFYQFALDARGVHAEFAQAGFTMREAVPHLGLSGLEDTFPSLERPLHTLRQARSAAGRALGFGVERLARGLTSHVILLVLERMPG